MLAQRRWLHYVMMLVLVLTMAGIGPQATRAAEIRFVVDNDGDADTSGGGSYCTDDPDDCSLRQAIELANAHLPVTDDKIISLSPESLVSADNIITINNPSGPLPALAKGKIQIIGEVDGNGNPLFQIDGNGRAVGFQLNSNENQIKFLSIYGFSDSGIEPFFGSGIYIAGSDNRVENCFIGIAPDGTVPPGKANFSGVRIDGGANNRIGSASGFGSANYISGNTQNGVLIRNAGNNFVQGNFIGLAKGNGTALTPRGNGQYGVQITTITVSDNASLNTIGGVTSNERNIIGSNGQAGILLRGPGTISNTIQSNYIGLDRLTDTDLGNNGAGITIEAGAGGNTIGGTRNAPLVISGNSGQGILIRAGGGSGPANNQILGPTYIGTTRNGAAALPNDGDGVLIEGGASNNAIIGSGSSQVRIAGNKGNGVQISGITTRDNRVEGAYIGIVSVSGNTVRLRNDGNGVLIQNSAPSSRVLNSYLSGNGGYGIRMTNPLSATISGNFVGLALNQSETISNTLGGIALESTGGLTARNTLIGGEGSARNIIGGNDGPGITVSGSGVISTTINNNLIGLRKVFGGSTFTDPAGNVGVGIRVADGPRETTISANTIVDSREAIGEPGGTGEGIIISGSGTSTTTITLNRIGSVLNGSVEIGRSNRGGLWIIDGPAYTTVTSNTISRNTGDSLRATSTTTTTVRANDLIDNGGNGIRVSDTARYTLIENNRIDDSEADGVLVEGNARDTQIISNTIVNNDLAAVRVSNNARRAKIVDNIITRNAAGIILDGATTGGGGSLSAPNHDIDPPILSGTLRLRINENGLLTGYVYTSTSKLEDALEPASACITCTIQFFAPDPELPTPDGQGFVKVADDVEVFDPTGRFATQIFGFSQNRPRQLLLTATDGFGNTSQYAVFNISTGLQLIPVDPVPPEQDAAPGQLVTYTHRLENVGSLDLSDIALSSESVNQLNWTTSLSPTTTQTPLILTSGESRLISVTLRLPTGSASNVRAGLQDVTRLIAASQGITEARATQLMTTTVLARTSIEITPRNQSGNGRPGTEVPYIHTIRNNGNISATVDLQARTIDPAQGTLWSTTLSNSSIEVGPGLTRDFTVRVTVPAGAQDKINGVPVRATTTVTGTVSGFPDQTRVLSDVTGVTLVQRAIMLRDENTFAAAGETVRIRHRVENISNGTATFRLNGNSSAGSSFRFISDTPGVTLTNNLFTLSNRSDSATGETNVFNFIVEITVDDRLLPGAVDVIDIFLSEVNGTTIGGANVKDRITITAGLVRPRLWLPMIRQQQPPQ